MTSNTCSVYGDGVIEQTFCRTSAPDDTTQRISPRKGAIPMAFIRVEPVAVHVRTDWFDGRPKEVTWHDERLTVTRLVAVREEADAYPAITGPRTLFEVETSGARLSLTYQHRSRRWMVTGLDHDAPRAA